MALTPIFLYNHPYFHKNCPENPKNLYIFILTFSFRTYLLKTDITNMSEWDVIWTFSLNLGLVEMESALSERKLLRARCRRCFSGDSNVEIELSRRNS